MTLLLLKFILSDSSLPILIAYPPLDVIKSIKDNFKIPVFAYQVSGEYSMIIKAVNNGLLHKDSIIESLISIKRAGASAIVTYFAMEIAKNLKKSTILYRMVLAQQIVWHLLQWF